MRFGPTGHPGGQGHDPLRDVPSQHATLHAAEPGGRPCCQPRRHQRPPRVGTATHQHFCCTFLLFTLLSPCRRTGCPACRTARAATPAAATAARTPSTKQPRKRASSLPSDASLGRRRKAEAAFLAKSLPVKVRLRSKDPTKTSGLKRESGDCDKITTSDLINAEK